MSAASGGFRLLDPEAASVCSDVSGSTGDDPSEVVLALERKSVQPYKTKDEYLFAMMEDLSEWFNTLYDVTINPESFFEDIETGVLLCQHANAVQDFIHESGITTRQSNPRSTPLSFAEDGVRYKRSAKAGTFLARDNISNFLSWCVRLGIPDDLRFETEDLVNRRHERNVILCLLEVARRGAKYGMLAPQLIQLEQEIDRELAGESPPPSPPPQPQEPQPQRKTCDLMSLDEMVRDMVSRCTCPSQFPMVKVSEGKYRIGDSQTLIFVRILRNHVMVRIGGGWDTLENYLDRHDPCRCHNKGHRQGRAASPGPRVTTKRRASAPNAAHLTALQLTTKPVPRDPAIVEAPDIQVTSPTRRTSVASSTPSRDRVTRKPGTQSQHSSPRTKRRNLPTIPGQAPRQHQQQISPSSDRSISPTAFRPKSARQRRNSELSVDSGSSREDLLDDRPRHFRPRSALDGHRRVSDIKASDLSVETKERLRHISSKGNSNDMLMITRGDSGKHTVDRGENMDDPETVPPAANGMSRTFSNSSNRFQISPDKLLPNKMKNFTRSASSDQTNGLSQKSRSFSVDSDSESSFTNNSVNSNGRTPANQMTRTWSHDSNQSLQSSGSDINGPVSGVYFTLSPEERKARFGSNFSLDVEEYPDAPPEDEELNRQMEELFEEYRKIEKGTIMSIQYQEPTPRRAEESKKTSRPSGKPDISKAKSRIKEYLESSKQRPGNQNKARSANQVATPRRSQTPTPRRSTTPTPMLSSDPRRAQTPTPGSYRPTTPVTSARTTPTMPRRNLPKTPSSSSVGSSSQTSSTSAPVVRRQAGTTPRAGGSTAWKRLSRSTTDLSGLCDSKESDKLTRNALTTHSTAGSATPRRPQSARPVAANRTAASTNRPTTPLNMSSRQPTTPSNRPMVATNRNIMNNEGARACQPTLTGERNTSAFNRVSKEKPAHAHSTHAPVRRRSQSVDRRHFVNEGDDAGEYRNTGARRSRFDGATNTLSNSKTTTQKANLSSASAINIGSQNTSNSSINSVSQQLSLQSQSAVDWSHPTPLSPEVLAKPRKDKREGPKTKIPQPTSRRCQSADPFSNGLKRYDSGVDINNMSPTESSVHGDEEVTWSEGVALTPQAISCLSAQVRDAFADDDGEFF